MTNDQHAQIMTQLSKLCDRAQAIEDRLRQIASNTALDAQAGEVPE